MKSQLEFEFCRIPELDSVKKAIFLLEEVRAELEEEKEFTVHELWEIHNLAKKIENHGREFKLRAAWNLGRLENEKEVREMPRKESEEFELFDGANELFRRVQKGEITQKELTIRLKPVRQVLKALRRLNRCLGEIVELHELLRKGKITKEEFDLEKDNKYQEYKKNEKEAKQLIKIIKSDAVQR